MTTDERVAPAGQVHRAVLEWREQGPLFATNGEMAGLDFLRAMITGDVVMPPVAQVLGIRVREAEPGRVLFTMPVPAYFTNHLGYLAGGILAAGLDAALGCAVLASLEATQDIVTLDLDVDFLRPVRRPENELSIIAETAHVGRNRALAVGRVVDEAGKTCAIGKGSCLLREKRAGS